MIIITLFYVFSNFLSVHFYVPNFLIFQEFYVHFREVILNRITVSDKQHRQWRV